MAELIPTLSSIAAVIFFVFALQSRRRHLEAKTLLAEISLRFDAAQKQAKQFEMQAKNQQEQTERSKSQLQQLEKALEESQQKLSDRTVEWSKLKSERENFVERASLQKEHLVEQVEVLTQQLAEAIREKKLATEDAGKLQKEFDERAQKQAEALRAQLRDNQFSLQAAKREKQHLESSLEKLRDQTGKVKVEELKRYKLKVVRLEQLYTSMKGLREMAEERNKNWETALRYFAEHILLESHNQDHKLPLGPLVGAALEKIGARLVDEALDHSRDELEASDELAEEPDHDLIATETAGRSVTLQPVQL